jgi:hypothetical protein
MADGLIPSHYKKSEAYLAAVDHVKGITSNKRFNMFQDLMILCKDDECPYVETCTVREKFNMKDIKGTRCPYELGLAMRQTEQYIAHFIPDYEEATADPIQLQLIGELVDFDIQISRADRVTAVRGDFLDDVITGITPNGMIVSNKDIAKWVTYKNGLVEKRHKTMELLNSTPKDKAGSTSVNQDFARYMMDLQEKAKILDNAYEVKDETIRHEGLV